VRSRAVEVALLASLIVPIVAFLLVASFWDN